MNLTNRKRAVERSAILLVLMMCALCAGCMDYKEEIWFNRDLSGTITMDITIPEMFVTISEQAGRTDNIFTEEGIRSRFEPVEGLSVISAQAYTVGEDRVIRISLKFDSLEAFRMISNASKDTDFLGDITVSQTQDGNIQFMRTISLADSAVTSFSMYDDLLNRRFWITRIHFPGYVLSTNAPEENINEDTHDTVTWAYSVAVLTRGPQTMEAVFTGRGSSKLMPLALAAVVFFIVFAALYKVLWKIAPPAAEEE